TESVPSLCARGTGACPTGFTPAVAAMKPFVNAYPIPNVAQCAVGTANCDQNVATFNGAYNNTNNLDSSSLRLDWTVTNKMTLFTRASNGPSDGIIRNTSGIAGFQRVSFGARTLTLGQTYVLSPRMTNDLRYNYSFTPSISNGYADTFG